MRTLITALVLSFATTAFATSRTRTDEVTSESGGPVSFPAGYSVPSSGTVSVAGTTTFTGTLSATSVIRSGTASLTLTAGTNVAAVVTPVTLNYYLIGNLACAFGQVSIDPTSGATASTFTLTLPVTRAANFSGTAGASGHAGILGAEVGSCLATNGAKTVTCNYVSGGTAVELVPVHFCHSVTGN